MSGAGAVAPGKKRDSGKQHIHYTKTKSMPKTKVFGRVGISKAMSGAGQRIGKLAYGTKI